MFHVKVHLNILEDAKSSLPVIQMTPLENKEAPEPQKWNCVWKYRPMSSVKAYVHYSAVLEERNIKALTPPL